jgi:hypothetical protein
MATVGLVLVLMGAMIVGGIWLLIVAFSESILWGLGCFFIPFVSLIFVIMHFDKAAKPFGIWLVGLIVMFGGSYLGGGAH